MKTQMVKKLLLLWNLELVVVIFKINVDLVSHFATERVH
jgi:hypothetical protein